MTEKYRQQLHDVAAELVNPEREFPPSTPHKYPLNLYGAVATVAALYPDAPTLRQEYDLPPFHNGQAWSGA